MSPFIPSFCWRRVVADEIITEYGAKTIPLSAEIYVGNITIKAKSKMEAKAELTIDTKDGIKATFPLQVQQKDMGYFEI